jgi:predicted DsbA family dithiol-disulfide isomerase
VAAVRRRQVARELGGRVHFERRTFLLLPGEGQRPVHDDYVISHRKAAAQRVPELGFSIPRRGLPYPRSSVPPQLLAMRVQTVLPGRLEALEETLFRAVFVGLEDVSAPAVLRRCARQAGVPEEEVERALADEELRARAFAEHAEAQDAGITAIPTLLVGGRVLSGAVPASVYRTAIARALAEQQSAQAGQEPGG